MGVEVRVFSMTGRGLGNQAYFADSFVRADQPFYLGDNWHVCFSDADVQTTASLAQSEINCSASTLVISQVGGGNTPKFFGFPARFNSIGCWGRSQFAEIKLVAFNAGFNSTLPGPAVLSRMNDASAYWLEFDNVGAVVTYAVQRWVNNVPSVIIGGRACAAGDTIRIEAVVSSSAVVITTFKNGVQDATATDNSGSRLTAGIPGLHCLTGLNGNTDSATYNNFKCGTLPQISTLATFP